METVSWPGNISVKILLAKIAFLFFFQFCYVIYLFNTSSFCIGSISWCCFVVLLLCWCSLVPLFWDIPIVPPVFWSYASVPVFRHRIPLLIRCSTGIPCSVVPCSGVLGFIVCHKSILPLVWLMKNSIPQSQVIWVHVIAVIYVITSRDCSKIYMLRKGK